MYISNFSNCIVISRKGITICKAILVSPGTNFRYGLSYSTPQKGEERRGNAITQPRIFNGMGPRLDNGISLVSSLFEGWSMTDHH